MDDKDKFITVSRNDENNNEDEVSSQDSLSDEQPQEVQTENLTEEAPPQNVRHYDDFMYEPIGFEDELNTLDFGGIEKKKKHSNNERFMIACLLVVFFVIIAMAVVCISIDLSRSDEVLSSYKSNQSVVLYKESKPISNSESYEADEDGRYSTEGVAALVRPSIVEIYTYSDKMHKQLVNTGSGIIVSENGYVVTNAHVLSSEGYHTIITSDDKTYDAEIVGRDTKTDIAVIKVNGAELSAAVLGSSNEVIPGEQVMAIGNPAGLSGTVTDGIVSAVNRKIKSDSTGFEMNCIQTNADISPGNSGGALVNMFGQVIGITSSKYVSSSYEGLGFAITIDDALPIIEELINNGFVSGRFRAGITIMATNSEQSRAAVEAELGHELPENFYGIYIALIDDDSKIAETELKEGDFITRIGENPISSYSDLYEALCNYEIGDKIPAKCAHFEDDGDIVYYDIEFEIMEDTSGNF